MSLRIGGTIGVAVIAANLGGFDVDLRSGRRFDGFARFHSAARLRHGVLGDAISAQLGELVA